MKQALPSTFPGPALCGSFFHPEDSEALRLFYEYAAGSTAAFIIRRTLAVISGDKAAAPLRLYFCRFHPAYRVVSGGFGKTTEKQQAKSEFFGFPFLFLQQDGFDTLCASDPGIPEMVSGIQLPGHIETQPFII